MIDKIKETIKDQMDANEKMVKTITLYQKRTLKN